MVGATPAGQRNQGQEYYPLACSEVQDNVGSCEVGALESRGLQGLLEFPVLSWECFQSYSPY